MTNTMGHPLSFEINFSYLAELLIYFLQDNSKVGIRATLSRMSDMLQHKDEVLWNHVQNKNKACLVLT